MFRNNIESDARYCRCSLPIFHPQLALLIQIKNFGRGAGIESCGEDSVVLPRTGSGPVKSERCRNGAVGESSTFRLFVSMI